MSRVFATRVLATRVTADLNTAIAGCGVILATVPAAAHENLLTALEPHLPCGQVVVLNPGCESFRDQVGG